MCGCVGATRSGMYACVPHQLCWARFLWRCCDLRQPAGCQAAIAYLNPPGFDAEAEMEAIRATDEKESGTAAATWSDLFAMARPMAVGIVLMTYQP